MMKKQFISAILCLLILALSGCAWPWGGSGGTASLTDIAVPEKLDKALSAAIISEYLGEDSLGEFKTEAHRVLRVEDDDSQVTVYAIQFFQGYDFWNNEITKGSAGANPVAVTFAKSGGDYTLTEFWTPDDGDLYASSMEKKFPADLLVQAYNDYQYYEAMEKECDQKATDYFAAKQAQ